MKLPPQATKVFHGEIFDVYHWDQTMFDGSTETFEMLKRPNSLQIIPIVGDKILLSREEQPNKGEFITLLGGRQEEGEDPLEAAKRELLEESGFATQLWEEIRTYEPYTKIDWIVHVFVAKHCTKIAEQQLDPGEKISVFEVTFDEFFEIATSEQFWCRELAYDLLRMKVRYPEKLATFRKQLFE